MIGIIRFLYTGTVDLSNVDLSSLRQVTCSVLLGCYRDLSILQAAEFMGLADLMDFLNTANTQPDPANNNLTVKESEVSGAADSSQK